MTRGRDRRGGRGWAVEVLAEDATSGADLIEGRPRDELQEHQEKAIEDLQWSVVPPPIGSR